MSPQENLPLLLPVVNNSGDTPGIIQFFPRTWCNRAVLMEETGPSLAVTPSVDFRVSRLALGPGVPQ